MRVSTGRMSAASNAALKIPTVAVLERLAEALDSDIGAFFVTPRAGEKFPAPLRGGRKARAG